MKFDRLSNFLCVSKYVYSEKATKFCEIFTLPLSIVHTDKSKVEILQNFVAFSEYMNFNDCQVKRKTKATKVTYTVFYVMNIKKKSHVPTRPLLLCLLISEKTSYLNAY